MKIVIVEDQRLYRDFIRRHCEQELGVEVVGEAEGVSEAMAVIRKTDPDVVLLDLQLNGESGFIVADTIVAEGLRARCLVLSGYCSPVVIAQIEKGRVSGYVDKNHSGPAMLGYALGRVARGQTYFSPTYQDALKKKNSAFAFDRILSPREQKVLGMIGQGFDNQEIAAYLGMAVQTVMTHRKRVMRKLEIHDTAKLIKYAIEAGFAQFGG